MSGVVEHALALAARGWKVFPLATDGTGGKIPTRNCSRCSTKSPRYEHHDKRSCSCILCHGFHAATSDPDVVQRMWELVPDGYLAVRTGRRSDGGSGLLVIDAEVDDADGYGVTGLEVMDAWEMWSTTTNVRTGERSSAGSLPRDTLTARSVSGGVHLYLELPDWAPAIRSGRVLPSVDVKCEFAYVGVPCGRDGRTWLNTDDPVIVAPDALVRWLAGSSVRRNGSSGWAGGYTWRRDGYDFNAFLERGCPDGHRDIFTNELIFRLRKRNVSWEDAWTTVYAAWRRFAQPGKTHGEDGGPARYEMPWEHLVYKLQRVWREVEPEEALPETFERWTARVNATEPQQVGRVALAANGVVERWG